MSRYFKDNQILIVSLLLLGLLVIAILLLYNINIEVIIYVAIIYYLAIFLINLFLYQRYTKTLKQLANYTLYQTQLPQSNQQIEQDYQSIINRYIMENQEKRQQIRSQMIEMNDFFALWTHQIKTPIAAINLLLQTNDSPINKDLQNSLFAIEQYVELILQYLKSEDANQDLVISKYSLDDIIKTAIKKYSPIFINKNIKLNYQATNIYLVTDAKWFTFIVEQILSNALKYTNHGHIDIYLDDHQLIIQDSGIGIEQSDIPRIFDKGYTGFNGRMYLKSSGIGLYLVKKMLAKLQSDIKISSILNHGTTVMIDLSNLTKM